MTFDYIFISDITISQMFNRILNTSLDQTTIQCKDLTPPNLDDIEDILQAMMLHNYMALK